jgi:hypothetical protein
MRVAKRDLVREATVLQNPAVTPQFFEHAGVLVLGIAVETQHMQLLCVAEVAACEKQKNAA